MKDCEALASVPYFRGLREEIVCSILEYSKVKVIPKGGYLFRQGDVCKYLYIIKEGLIEIFQLGEDGKKLILHHAGKGAFLGDTILFNDGTHEAHACAKEDSEILMVRKKNLETLIYDFPEIGVRMLMDFGKRIKSLKSLVAEVALTDVRGRIAKLILELIKNGDLDGESTVVLDNIPTQDEMAYRIGTVREVLCRELHSLEKDNLIKVKRGKITVNNVKKLREMVPSEDGDNLFPITLPMNRP